MNTPKTREDFKWARRFLRDGCIDDREYRIRMLGLIEDIIETLLPDVAPVCNNGEWTVDNTRLRDEVQRLKTASDYLTARNEELERGLKETRENLARTEDARVHLDNNVTTLRKNIKDLGSSYDALLKEHDRLKAENELLGNRGRSSFDDGYKLALKNVAIRVGLDCRISPSLDKIESSVRALREERDVGIHRAEEAEFRVSELEKHICTAIKNEREACIQHIANYLDNVRGAVGNTK